MTGTTPSSASAPAPAALADAAIDLWNASMGLMLTTAAAPFGLWSMDANLRAAAAIFDLGGELCALRLTQAGLSAPLLHD